MSSGTGSATGWAQLLAPPADAGRDLQALLRWKYTEGWVPVRTLQNRHRRLSQYTTAQLEHAARHSRRHGSHRFSVQVHNGRTVILLNQQHRRDHLIGRGNARGGMVRGKFMPPSETSSESDDVDRTTLLEDEVRDDQESVSAWEAIPTVRDRAESSGLRGPDGVQGHSCDERIAGQEPPHHGSGGRPGVRRLDQGTRSTP